MQRILLTRVGCAGLAAALCSGLGGLSGELFAQRSPMVEATPLVEVNGSGDGGAPSFHQVVGAVRLSDGTIVIADVHGPIHYFDRNGAHRRTAGRAGDGPGEVRHVGWMGQCRSGAVHLWDLTRRRMIVLNHEGELIREYSVPPHGTPGPAPFTVACSRAGVFALQPLPTGGRPREDLPFTRGRAPVTVADTAGQSLAVVPDVPGPELVVLQGGAGPRPLGAVTLLAVGPGLLYVNTGDSDRIDSYSLDGQFAGMLSAGLKGRPASLRNYGAAVDALVTSVRGPIATVLRQRLLDLPMPATLPPYAGLHVDPDGVLWAVLSWPGDPGTRLRALSGGAAAGTELELAAAVRVTEVGRDYLVGVREDDAGVPHVVLYRLSRP